MAAIQLGAHAPAVRLIAHLSDTHFLAGGALLYGRTDTDSTVNRAMEQLERSGLRPDAIVITGDIADRGEPEAYRRVRGIVETAARRMGSELVWVMGNHDVRAAFRAELLDEGPPSASSSAVGVTSGDADAPADADAPIDRVTDCGGLRIVSIDTSVPGYHHGELSPDQLGWLSGVLATPAPLGTVLALHHPPIPSPLPLMSILELQQIDALAAVLRGTDVRAILGGHLHHATSGMFAGIPVSVAAATCYTMDVSAPARELTGVIGGQSLNLMHVYNDQIVHSVVPIGWFDTATHFDEAYLARMEALTPEGRLDVFSRQQ